MKDSLKKCSYCHELKDITMFGIDKKVKSRHKSHCKDCEAKRVKNRGRTKDGLISLTHYRQKTRSSLNGFDAPNYSVDELKDWAYNQDLFHVLYDTWVDSKYSKMLFPSIDRKDDYKGYTFDNIQLMTWQDNKNKHHRDRKNGTNNKISKPVLQYDMDCNYLREFHSVCAAARSVNMQSITIVRCCQRELSRYSSGGYRWKYKNIDI